MSKPRLLDCYSGAGGSARGYQMAGFHVTGIDHVPQPRYAGDAFIQADALEYITEHGREYDAIHASPPCQAHSTIAKQQRTRREYHHPDLVSATRSLLIEAGRPWIMENVPGAPMQNCIVLCGSSFGLDVRRHRLFEVGGWDCVLAPPCAHHMQPPRFISLDKRRSKASGTVPVHGGGQLSSVVPVYGYDRRQLAGVVGVHGHLNYKGEMELRKRAMGIDWMNPDELTQAIPPAYTNWVGEQLMRVLTVAA